MAMSQAQKSLVTMCVLLVLAGAVGSFAYWGVYKKEQAEEKKHEESAKIFTIDRSKVKALSLTAKGATTKLEKVGEEWQISEPIKARADKPAVDAIISKFADLKAEDLNAKSKEKEKPEPEYVVAEGADAAPKFGLDHPTITATLTVDDKPVTLDVGIENSFDKSIYFRRGGENTIFMADSGLKGSLEKSLFDLRDKSIVTHDDKDVTAFAASGNGEAWSAERDGDDWKVTSPFQDKGDKQIIENVLVRLRTMKAKAFAADALVPADAARYGLDKPAAEAIFFMGADKTRKTLQIGEVGEGKDKKAYTHLLGGGPVAEVDTNIIRDILKPVEDLRDKTIAPFKRNEVTRIEFIPATGDKLVVDRTLEKAPGATSETDKFTLEGSTEKIKTWKMSSAIYALMNMKGAAIAAENPTDLSQYGLDKPAWTYVVHGEGDKELSRIIVGNQAEKRMYVMKAGGQRVYEVEKSTIDGLPAKADDIIDKGGDPIKDIKPGSPKAPPIHIPQAMKAEPPPQFKHPN
jgi:hypothetical protein